MIDLPTETAGRWSERLSLEEEAPALGWQRVEFLTAVMDAATSQLSALEEERALKVVAYFTPS